MGLFEQIQAGALLERKTTSFTVDPSGIGEFNIGTAAMILDITAAAPTRLRIYDNQSSRDDVTESARSFSNKILGQNIALIADINITEPGTYYLDPSVYAMPSSGQVYYRATGGVQTITLNIFLLEDSTIVMDPPNKRTIGPISQNLAPNANHIGTLTGVPPSYILISASLDSGTFGRIRLYNKLSSISNVVEQNRTFHVEPPASVGLIVDAIITGSAGHFHFTPKLVGANLDTLDTTLQSIPDDAPTEVYYILQNVGGSTETISVSFNVFALEN